MNNDTANMAATVPKRNPVDAGALAVIAAAPVKSGAGAFVVGVVVVFMAGTEIEVGTDEDGVVA